MTVFAGKEAFVALGLEVVKPSATLVSQDCSICTEPLIVHENHTKESSNKRGYHSAVRVLACGHIHGQECLDKWFDVGNSCPICNRMLFEPIHKSVTQGDYDYLLKTLSPHYGEDRVDSAIGRLLKKSDEDHVALRRYHEQELAKQKMTDAKKQNDEFALSVEELLDSDEEMEFGDDNDDEGEDDGQGDEEDLKKGNDTLE
ncbi:hypothetical protein EK21DRAFT_51730 [Setomelanomma holmii]|uniref:RING-type domain-containing protein n=1 Tax=Setomelanomma holmii TaxID=210430 RepID=A0A9P4LUC2_9PLEO|nr:hypothetical protein EK21DRAFT_51730 [Setomelanomma holmii]